MNFVFLGEVPIISGDQNRNVINNALTKSKRYSKWIFEKSWKIRIKHSDYNWRIATTVINKHRSFKYNR